MKRMDTDGDGVVDYDEFSKFVEVGAAKQTKGSHRYDLLLTMSTSRTIMVLRV